jgi:hypothetical protein
VSRSNIEDISHPGKTAAIISTLLMMFGGPGGFGMMIYANSACGEYGYNDAELALVWGGLLLEVAALASVFVAIWGYAKWIGSSSAAAPKKDTTGPKLTPVTMSDGQRTYLGAGLRFDW